jgi:hypothetical protein
MLGVGEGFAEFGCEKDGDWAYTAGEPFFIIIITYICIFLYKFPSFFSFLLLWGLGVVLKVRWMAITN